MGTKHQLKRLVSAHDPDNSPFAVIGAELRVMIRCGMDANEIAGRIGRIIDVLVGELEDEKTKRRVQAALKPKAYVKVIATRLKRHDQQQKGGA
jgi:hypothetical protein